MALIVEDGTGKNNAETYCSIGQANSYFIGRNITAWDALSDEARLAALRDAADYMAIYSAALQGCRAVDGQALDWPREGVTAYGQDIAADIVPQAVVQACARLALKASAGELSPEQTAQKTRVKVGPIETEYAAAQGGLAPLRRFPDIDRLLAPFMASRNPYSVPLGRS